MALKTICNGEYEIVKITEDLFAEATEIFVEHFMRNENLTITTGVFEDEEAVNEFIIFLDHVLRMGISFGARNCETKKLVALRANKILNAASDAYFEEIFAKFTTQKMKVISAFIDTMEKTFDIFKEWEIDCVFELQFLGVHRDYRQLGLGGILTQFSIDYALQMKNGTLPESETAKFPPQIRGARPQAICSVYTSAYTQAIGRKLGFQVIHSAPYKDFTIEGRTFADRIDPKHDHVEFVAKRL